MHAGSGTLAALFDFPHIEPLTPFCVYMLNEWYIYAGVWMALQGFKRFNAYGRVSIPARLRIDVKRETA